MSNGFVQSHPLGVRSIHANTNKTASPCRYLREAINLERRDSFWERRSEFEMIIGGLSIDRGLFAGTASPGSRGMLASSASMSEVEAEAGETRRGRGETGQGRGRDRGGGRGGR